MQQLAALERVLKSAWDESIDLSRSVTVAMRHCRVVSNEDDGECRYLQGEERGRRDLDTGIRRPVAGAAAETGHSHMVDGGSEA